MQVIQEQIELSDSQSSMAAVMVMAERPYCAAGVAYRMMLLACVPDLDSRLSSNFRDSNQPPFPNKFKRIPHSLAQRMATKLGARSGQPIDSAQTGEQHVHGPGAAVA